MKRAWLVAGIVVLVAACSRGTDAEDSARAPLPEDLPLCADLFKDGEPVDPARFGLACRNEQDELEVPRYANLPCVPESQGSSLFWNSRAWGYEQQPMTLWGPDDEKMPTDEILKCMGSVAAGAETGPPAS